MNDYPEIQIGCDRNDAGEMLVRVGGVLCGTVNEWKSRIAQAESSQPVKVFDPHDASFRDAVLTVLRDAQKRHQV